MKQWRGGFHIAKIKATDEKIELRLTLTSPNLDQISDMT